MSKGLIAIKSRVSRNALYNVAGVVLPTLAGIISVPILLQNLGTSRLGVFTLALGIIGFSGVFDLGLGRALTQSVATATGQGRALVTIAMHTRRTLPIVGAMGLVWGIGLWLMAKPIAVTIFRLDGDIAREATLGIQWLAIAIPSLLLSSSLIGVLEGLQRFGLVTAFRIPLNAMTFIAPALSSYIWQDVGLAIAALATVRLLGVFAWALVLNKVLPLRHSDDSQKLPAGAMWRFTGWLSVTNIIGPLMVHADRFYLTTLFPPASVAYYTVPLDTLSRATALPSAAFNALFPALSHVGSDSDQAATFIRMGTFLMLALWGMPILLASFLLETLLRLWLNADFAAMSIDLSQWLLLAVLVNGFAYLPYTLLQSAGRADLTAKLHLAELPIYAVALIILVGQFGVLGAAIAWTFRVTMDTVLLYWLAYNLFPRAQSSLALGSTLVGAAIFGFWILHLR